MSDFWDFLLCSHPASANLNMALGKHCRLTASATGKRKKDMIITVREGWGRVSESLIMATKEWALCMSSAEMKRGKGGKSTGTAFRFWRLLVILMMIMPKHEVSKSLKGCQIEQHAFCKSHRMLSSSDQEGSNRRCLGKKHGSEKILLWVLFFFPVNAHKVPASRFSVVA